MGPPGDAEGWLASRGLACPLGTQVAEHLLKLASSPADIRRLLSWQQPGEGSGEALAGGEGSGGSSALAAAAEGAGGVLSPDVTPTCTSSTSPRAVP